MRGFLQPAKKTVPSETQTRYRALSRHRQSKLAKTAGTTLVKAHQWARGDGVTAEVATALEGALTALGKKK